jgi:hypothetical protein
VSQYADIRKEKELAEASGQKLKRALKSMVIGDEIARMLVIRAHDVLRDARAAGHLSADVTATGTWYVGHGPKEVKVPLARCERLVLSPRVANHACCRRVISASEQPSGGADGGLTVSAAFLSGMSEQPLRPLELQKFVSQVEEREPPAFSDDDSQWAWSGNAKRGDAAQALPASELAEIFDLSNHPQARDYTATAMLRRLEKDVQHFNVTYSRRSLFLTSLTPSDVYTCVEEARDARRTSEERRARERRGSFLDRLTPSFASPAVSRLDTALDAVARRIDRLDSLHVDDAAAMGAGLAAATALANCAPGQASSRADLVHHLHSSAGDEVSFSFAQVAAQLLSTQATTDLLQLNPQLNSSGRLATLMRASAATLYRTTRLAYVAQCRSQARGLHAHLKSLRTRAPELAPWMLDQECRELATRSGALARALSVRRHTLRPADGVADADEGLGMGGRGHGAADVAPASGASYVYDPRFAVFEFSASVFLREGQVRLINECVETLDAGRSRVYQMIMGAGKTSTILPLLALLYADGRQLMVQVVPNPLLMFTLNVMRSRFSSVVSKAVYTFHFERATDVSEALLQKLQATVHRRAVVVSTPTALKSFALRFIELAHTLDYMSRAEPGKEHNFNNLVRNVQQLLFAGRGGRPDKEDGRLYELRKQVGLCHEILGLFKGGVLVLDEVDTILHPLRSELNWPLGGKVPLDFTTDKEAPGMRWLLPFHALDPFFLATGGKCVMEVQNSPYGQKLLRLIEAEVQRGCNEQALQRVPHLVLLDRRFYRDAIRPLLAEWLLLLLLQLGLNALDYDEALVYLNGDVQQVPPHKLRQLSVEGKQLKLLNLAFELLETIVPFVLSKVDRVAFGLLSTAQLHRSRAQLGEVVPRKRRLLAVPFVGKDTPSRASEFSHPDVVISLTILAYRYEGLREADFVSVMHGLKHAMAAQFGPYHKREACRKYVAWVEGAGAHVRGTPRRGGGRSASVASVAEGVDGGVDGGGEGGGEGTDDAEGSFRGPGDGSDRSDGEVWPLHLVDLGDEEQMSALFGLLRRQPQVVRHYLFERVFPRTMEFQQMKLSACGQELGGDLLFGRRIGFSGTPSELLPEEFRNGSLDPCKFADGDDAKMLHVLTSPNVIRFVTSLPADWSPMSLLHSVANWTPPLHALIDTGALVTGMSNLDVATALLLLGMSHIRGCVFIDDDGHKRILLRDGLRVMRLEQCGLALSQRFSFYDQVRTITRRHSPSHAVTRRHTPSHAIPATGGSGHRAALAATSAMPVLVPTSKRASLSVCGWRVCACAGAHDGHGYPAASGGACGAHTLQRHDVP